MKKKLTIKNLTCIACPMGCDLEVTYTPKKIVEVKGNTCKRGITYAETEIFHPERIVTTTVHVKGARIEFVPVKTEKTIPKKLTHSVIKRAAGVTLKAPVKVGDIVIKDILGSGVNLVVTRSLKCVSQKSKKRSHKKSP